MGTGRSGANGTKSSGTYTVTSAPDADGNSIDLTDIPLTYGGKDSSLNYAQRKSIEAFENKRYKYRSEYAYTVDDKGNLVGREVHGNSGSVSIPSNYLQSASAVSHNHPRGKKESGMLGGTFSDADLSMFSRYQNIKTFRATASEGTYSISKGDKFNPKGFRSMANASSQKHMQNYKAESKKFYSQAISGKISVNDYYKKCKNSFNTALVNIHNDLLAGQKQYGYTYTLEKR